MKNEYFKLKVESFPDSDSEKNLEKLLNLQMSFIIQALKRPIINWKNFSTLFSSTFFLVTLTQCVT